jgi:hypothetical protein
VAAAIDAHPEIGDKIPEPRAEVMLEPATGTDPAWEWPVRQLAIAYRARGLDYGTSRRVRSSKRPTEPET